MPHEFLTFRDQRTEGRHPIRLYTRYINKVGGVGWMGLFLRGEQPCRGEGRDFMFLVKKQETAPDCQ